MSYPSCLGKPWQSRSFSTLPDGTDCLCARCNCLRSQYYMSFGKPASTTEECEGKYFIVCPGSVSGGPVYGGSIIYPDRPTAIKAAYAQAAQYPEKQFCVCKVVGVAKTSKPPVSYTDYDTKKKVK